MKFSKFLFSKPNILALLFLVAFTLIGVFAKLPLMIGVGALLCIFFVVGNFISYNKKKF